LRMCSPSTCRGGSFSLPSNLMIVALFPIWEQSYLEASPESSGYVPNLGTLGLRGADADAELAPFPRMRQPRPSQSFKGRDCRKSGGAEISLLLVPASIDKRVLRRGTGFLLPSLHSISQLPPADLPASRVACYGLAHLNASTRYGYWSTATSFQHDLVDRRPRAPTKDERSTLTERYSSWYSRKK
jgi:hypothetical protein